MSKYGKLPKALGRFPIESGEVFYYLYLPISLAGGAEVVIPTRLKHFMPLVQRIADDEPERFKDENVYITAKRMFVSPQVTANRPGWHADGFGSNDLNYVWYDCLPTIFNCSEFRITNDHIKSLQEFEAQALPQYNFTFPCFELLKLDPYVVHAVAEADRQMMRTFVKISISPDKYNLIGNSINHDMMYHWEYFDRAMVRNDPTRAQSDAYKGEPAP